MAIATPDHLLLLHNRQKDDAFCFDVYERNSLAPAGMCTLQYDSPRWERPLRCSVTIDAPDAARPALRSAILRWYDALGIASQITLDDGSVIDTGVPSQEAETLYQQALAFLPPLTEASDVNGRFFARTPDHFAWVLNLIPRFDGQQLEAGFAFPANTPEDWTFFAQHGCANTDIRLRIIRHVTTEGQLRAALAEAEALRQAWFNASREAVRKQAAGKQKAFAARITAQLKPLGFRKKALHWTFTRPDGYHVDFNAQKSSFTDGFYFNLLLTEPDQHPWCMGLIDKRPFGPLLDWQAIAGDDFDNLLWAVVRLHILPMISEPVPSLLAAQEQASPD